MRMYITRRVSRYFIFDCRSNSSWDITLESFSFLEFVGLFLGNYRTVNENWGTVGFVSSSRLSYIFGGFPSELGRNIFRSCSPWQRSVIKNFYKATIWCKVKFADMIMIVSMTKISSMSKITDTIMIVSMTKIASMAKNLTCPKLLIWSWLSVWPKLPVWPKFTPHICKEF